MQTCTNNDTADAAAALACAFDYSLLPEGSGAVGTAVRASRRDMHPLPGFERVTAVATATNRVAVISSAFV